jgi:hypothetical protein
MILWTIHDVAEFLRCGRHGAQGWLDRNGVRPIANLGGGRGMGKRWLKSEVETALLGQRPKPEPKREMPPALAREHERAMAFFARAEQREQ